MTVGELIDALRTLDRGFEVKLSGDSMVFGNGYEVRQTHEGPTLQNVAQQDGYVVLWPECSWDEAIEYADAGGDGAKEPPSQEQQGEGDDGGN